jgi:hypothetical protein
VIANNVIDRNADGKGHTSVNASAIYFFGKELLCLCVNDGCAKLADIQDLGTRHTLADQTLQGQIHNLGCFLVLGADVAVEVVVAVGVVERE